MLVLWKPSPEQNQRVLQLYFFIFKICVLTHLVWFLGTDFENKLQLFPPINEDWVLITEALSGFFELGF